ncbi:MAG TPA: hypothetical protein DDW27_00375, partial [Bacteroidales bacterium]|nr:hypothetical protein [Bacteroidales bacterium]
YGCKGNHALALKYLRKALAESNSAVGIMAYQKAKEAQTESQSQEQDKPLSSEKGQTEDFSVPDLPASENKATMEKAGPHLTEYYEKLSPGIRTLYERYYSLLRTVSQQNIRAQQDPDNSIVFSRDFSKEIFMFQEVAVLLFGEYSNYGQALKKGAEAAGNSSDIILKDVPGLIQLQDKHMRLTRQMMELIEAEAACGDNYPCVNAVRAQMRVVEAELEEVEYHICLLTKSELDINYSATYKFYKKVSDAFKEAAYDFYAFTNPILEKVYAPSLNELMNTYRELVLLNHAHNVAGLGIGLPDVAQQYNQLKCVEPQPPGVTSEIKDPEIPKKDKKPCPLGEKGISAGYGVLYFELSCNHVKISGGQGLLASVNHDFNTHETTFWGGVGVRGQIGSGTLSVGASVGAQITIGQGDVVKDVAVTGSLEAGLGGLVKAEVIERWAIQGGPSVKQGVTSIIPNFPGISN